MVVLNWCSPVVKKDIAILLKLRSTPLVGQCKKFYLLAQKFCDRTRRGLGLGLCSNNLTPLVPAINWTLNIGAFLIGLAVAKVTMVKLMIVNKYVIQCMRCNYVSIEIAKQFNWRLQVMFQFIIWAAAFSVKAKLIWRLHKTLVTAICNFCIVKLQLQK